MEAYKSWVRQNRQIVSSLHSVAYTMTWCLPERFASSELTPETVSTLIGILTVMNQHIIETPTCTSGSGCVPHQFSLLGLEEDKSFPWSLCMSVIKELEVLTEMSAEHYFGKEQKWGPVASLEAIKLLLRLIILVKSGYKMLIDGGERKNVVNSVKCTDVVGGPEVPNTSLSPHRGSFAYCDPPPRPSRNGFNFGLYRQDSQDPSMQAMQRFGGNMAGPSWLRQVRNQQEESVARSKVSYNLRPLSVGPTPGPKNRALVCGEVLLISRPFLYVSLLWRYGLKSWRPWIVALSIDLIGMFLVSTSSFWGSISSTRLAKPHEVADDSFSTVELLELRRRRQRLAFYIMRSPFFDQYVRQRVDTVTKTLSPIPIVGLLSEKAFEFLLAIQGMYSYTAAS